MARGSSNAPRVPQEGKAMEAKGMKAMVTMLDQELEKAKETIAKCDALRADASPAQVQKLDELRLRLEGTRARITTARDLLSGRDFRLYTVDDEPVIIQPTEHTAKIIDAAEKLGARVIKHGRLG